MIQQKQLDIQKFADKLLEACKARDPSAQVTITRMPFGQEYVATIRYSGNIENYAFNPHTGAWVVCYTV